MSEKPRIAQTQKIDISLLQTFHLVAKIGSFSGAARELNISYQSAANHVRRLEQLYGTQLVKAEKGSREIVLTAPGRALHASLGAELDTIFARLSLLLRNVHSVMRFGVPQALFHAFFPEIVRQVKETHPDMELNFFERDTVLSSMMVNGELDACVCERFFGDASISQVLLGQYRLALVYPQHWARDYASSNDLASLQQENFITYEPGQTLRSRGIDFLTKKLGKAPQNMTTVSGSTSVMELVRAGIGYAIVPEWVAEAAGEKVKWIILDEMQTVKVYFATPVFLSEDPVLVFTREICRNVMGFRV
ncbi:MAG: LysR family transcriptional regulator [Alphaproteobacteria bacterium]|jgi:molybdate transport repressor ModE-like protein|uniref:LysR family transcriptional regulator n=2 Tax=Celeribacter baekdonensis TaxID=875171 RepID=K2JIE4_9RHOB|nr:LysR family transcriptional regulator [Celeribacter baekdonensis]MBU0645742.1 LysR family transcriptional regulator [Alphaproteobacteria bacterium]EKE74202.1 LysR family transcriptional regulator [Celeribacter baekdonensis B30]MBU1279689.1 LysR family transcriptional regulator [Alphaproteobacteria bacterium]MBU1574666.1 LysR family transcriptional regulator [Alphaproteobacteria bacterium]MBU1828899.1 LysR family transcriptional regulator [Alphaproteobacteria bacterium]